MLRKTQLFRLHVNNKFRMLCGLVLQNNGISECNLFVKSKHDLKWNEKSRDYKRLLFLSKPLMMNVWNLGSKETVGVIFKEGICAKLCLKHWFESDWHFCNITQSGWFWNSLSREKVLNHQFLKSLYVTSSTQMFFKIGVLRNIATFTGKHLC